MSVVRRLSGAAGGSLAFLVVSIAVLAMSAGASFWSGGSASDRVSHNFGAVERGARLQHVFRVKNHSAANITIENVVASCSHCSKVELVCDKPDCFVLSPGDSIAVVTAIEVREEVGSINREFYLYWRTPQAGERQRTVFSLAANVAE